jgi:ElaB/YqjD/DUF883 family membrane-anchored ribosome-binding protein
MAQRLSRLWGRRRSPDLDWQHRAATLEARVSHLEAELEGLQDAVHRRAKADDEQIEELRRRIARALTRVQRSASRCARRAALTAAATAESARSSTSAPPGISFSAGRGWSSDAHWVPHRQHVSS